MNPLKGKRWICVHFIFVCVLCEACFMPQELIWVAYIDKTTTARVQLKINK